MFFELTDITAHPVEKIGLSRSARRAILFSECPCGRRVQLEKVPFIPFQGKFQVPNPKSQIPNSKQQCALRAVR
jgi:hypothetical protein